MKLRVVTDKLFLKDSEDSYDEYEEDSLRWMIQGGVLFICGYVVWDGQLRESAIASYNSDSWSKVSFVQEEVDTK